MALVSESTKSKAGLILTGGGARAAYQVGVLKAVRELLPHPEKSPFPILCGTSAGAVNAATLAVFAYNFHAAVGNLLYVWEHFHVHHVYRSDPIGIARVEERCLAAGARQPLSVARANRRPRLEQHFPGQPQRRHRAPAPDQPRHQPDSPGKTPGGGTTFAADQGAGDHAEPAFGAHRGASRERAARDGTVPSARNRRHEPQRIEPSELSALRARLLPGADRARLPGHHGAPPRSAGVFGSPTINLKFHSPRPRLMNQPSDPFEFLKNLWGPMGLPLSGVAAPTLGQDEIERRIAELKLVENWLNMNLNVLRATVQGLELQKSGLAAMREAAEAGKAQDDPSEK